MYGEPMQVQAGNAGFRDCAEPEAIQPDHIPATMAQMEKLASVAVDRARRIADSLGGSQPSTKEVGLAPGKPISLSSHAHSVRRTINEILEQLTRIEGALGL